IAYHRADQPGRQCCGTGAASMMNPAEMRAALIEIGNVLPIFTELHNRTKGAPCSVGDAVEGWEYMASDDAKAAHVAVMKAAATARDIARQADGLILADPDRLVSIIESDPRQSIGHPDDANYTPKGEAAGMRAAFIDLHHALETYQFETPDMIERILVTCETTMAAFLATHDMRARYAAEPSRKVYRALMDSLPQRDRDTHAARVGKAKHIPLAATQRTKERQDRLKQVLREHEIAPTFDAIKQRAETCPNVAASICTAMCFNANEAKDVFAKGLSDRGAAKRLKRDLATIR
ncbi:MAG: hypothetical protein WAO78_13955, partial [Roseovarius sp.]